MSRPGWEIGRDHFAQNGRDTFGTLFLIAERASGWATRRTGGTCVLRSFLHALRTQFGLLFALIDVYERTRCACVEVLLFWHGGLLALWVMICRGPRLIHSQILHSSLFGVWLRLVCVTGLVYDFGKGACVCLRIFLECPFLVSAFRVSLPTKMYCREAAFRYTGLEGMQ